MLIRGSMAGQFSGSLAGVTAGHNKSGYYLRNRSTPTNPQSGRQTAVRNALTSLVQRWNNVLTAAQRQAWNNYAANVPVTNPLGDAINLSGQNWYVSCNAARLQAITVLSYTTAPVDDAPTVYNRGDFTTPAATYSEASGLSLAFTAADDWANEDDAFMLIYQGLPQNPGRGYFKGPYRLVNGVPGDATTAPTSPSTLAAAFLNIFGYQVTETQLVWTRIVVVRADGRCSAPRVLGPDAVTA